MVNYRFRIVAGGGGRGWGVGVVPLVVGWHDGMILRRWAEESESVQSVVVDRRRRGGGWRIIVPCFLIVSQYLLIPPAPASVNQTLTAAAVALTPHPLIYLSIASSSMHPRSPAR